jgi:integrase
MPIRIPMNDMSKSILRKYRGNLLNPKDPLFPIITKSMDEVQIDKAVENFIQITNKWLKRIGTELELPVKLTTYVARHSFATIQKNNGLSREYLKESLGHSSITTTERYLSSFEDDDVVEMHGKLLEGIV